MIARALLACIVVLSGCVVEERRPVGVLPVRTPGKPSTSTSRDAQLPGAPIATRVEQGVATSRVRVTIVPLGTIAYDGLTLPIVSPDGQFIAVQEGIAPTWDAVLGDGDQSLAATETGRRIAVYDVRASTLVRRIEANVPGAAVLGRDANTRGFLVECPDGTGSRRIALVNWVTGEPTWLTPEGMLAAHASLLDDGLLFARREGDVWSVEARDSRGTRSHTLPGEWCILPQPFADQSSGLVLALGRQGVQAHVVRLDVMASTGPDRLIARPAAIGEELRAASLCTSGVQPSAWADGDDGAIVFSPMRGALQSIAPSGNARTFPPGTIAGIRWKKASTDGWLTSTAKGLVFVPESELGSTSPRTVRVLAGAYVPRLVRNESVTSALLFGPSASLGGDQQLEVVRLLAEEES